MTTTTPGPPAGPRLDLARRGEQLAARHLCSLGMELLETNWRCAQGEIDLVLRDGVDLVFCEVKTRSGTGFGDPLEAITPAKAARLRRLAAAYLAETGSRAEAIRVDAVGIVWRAGHRPRLRHVRGVGS